MIPPRCSWVALLLPVVYAACAANQLRDVETWRREVSFGETPTWSTGQPLPLATAVRLANEQNERIALEGEQFLQAVISRARITADWLPTVEVVPDYIFRDKAAASVPFLADPTVLDVRARAELTLFDGFRRGARADAEALTIEQRRALLLDLRETVVLEVVQAYYRVLRAERRTAVLADSLRTQEQRVREIGARLRLGTARALDVSQSEAQTSRTRIELLDAKNDARAGRQALGLLVGAEVGDSELHDDFALPPEWPRLDALQQLAADARQDLRSAALAAEAARARVDVAIGQYYPFVGVSLDYFLSRDSLPTDRDWTGILTLHLPIFSGGRIDADVREAWSQFRQEVLRYSQLRRQIRTDLVVARDQLATLDDRLAQLATQARASAEALRQSEAGVRSGLATNLDLLTAQALLQRAQLDVVESELERKTAWLSTLRLTGALTAGTLDVTVPPPPPPRPAPQSPFVVLPG